MCIMQCALVIFIPSVYIIIYRLSVNLLKKLAIKLQRLNYSLRLKLLWTFYYRYK